MAALEERLAGFTALAGASLGLRAAGPGDGGAARRPLADFGARPTGRRVQIGPSYVNAAREAIGFD